MEIVGQAVKTAFPIVYTDVNYGDVQVCFVDVICE